MAEAHPDPDPGPGSSPAVPVPRLLGDIGTLVAQDPLPSGALWRLAEPGRQLDANLIHLRPGERIDRHAEPELDVLVLVVAGDGTLVTDEGEQSLAAGTLAWLPRGSARSLTAGGDGLSYCTVHRRRPGMQIRTERT